jgi:hypothetical protein
MPHNFNIYTKMNMIINRDNNKFKKFFFGYHILLVYAFIHQKINNSL